MPARILIIEDNHTNMELMAFLLRTFGHHPLSAYDGEEGLRLAGSERPDLIICDVHLPKIDGYGVLGRLRSDAGAPRLPVIAVTAQAMVGDRERLLAAGFDSYIGKPIDPEKFVDEIDRFLPAGLRSTKPVAHDFAEMQTAHPGGASARVLVVDDSPVNCELIRNTLEPFGFSVEIAEGTDAALARLDGRQFDLILSDLHMPESDGISFLRAVKADPVHAVTPFVFISASYTDDFNSEQALELGARGFLRRPIEPQTLIAEINACLAGQQGKSHGHDPGR